MQPPMLNAKFRAILLCSAMLLALSSCSTKAQRANKFYVSAQQYMSYGNLPAAARDLQLAVAARDDVPEIWYALGQVRLASGAMPEAFTAFTRADELRPGDIDTLRPLAYTGYMIGATRLSKDAVDRLLILAPADPQGLAVKGLLALDKGETAAAPSDETGLMLKARAIAIQGNVDAAIKLLEESARTAGPKSGLTFALLQFYRAKGDSAGMIRIFPQLIDGQKKNYELALDYCNLLYRTGKVDDARKIWSDTVLAARGDARFIAWAFEFYDMMEPGNGPAYLDPRISRVGPSPLRTAAGQYLVMRKDFARAAALLNQGKGVSDLDRGIYAVALDGLGRRAEAQALVQSMLGAVNQRQDPNALMLRARTALAAKNFDRANADAQNAIIADPSNIDARFVLADSYRINGQQIRVRQVLAQGVRDLPRNRRALLAYLQFLHSIGDNASAVSAARNFADANRSQPWGWGILGITCQQINDQACMASAARLQQAALRDLTFTNPARPMVMRGLFSPLPTPG
jgi:tetratricopeptide (TPR) repeat protein